MNIEDIEKQNELKNKKIPFLEELKDFKRISNSGKTLEVINEKEDDIIEEFIIFILKRLKGFFLIKVKQDEGEIYGAFLIKDWYSYIEKEINYFIKDNSEEDKKTMKETYKIINN